MAREVVNPEVRIRLRGSFPEGSVPPDVLLDDGEAPTRDGDELVGDVPGGGGGAWGSITGTLSAQTDLQAALDAKQPLDTDLTAIAALTSAANKVPVATGAGTWALADFTPAGFSLTLSANSTIGGTISGVNTGDQTITLTGDVTGSGTGSFAATLATAQPTVHTWALAQTFTVAPVFTDQAGSRTALGLGTLATLSAAPAGTLSGATLAAGVTASSLTTLGTLTALATAAGVEANFGGSTASPLGTITANPDLTTIPAILVTGMSTDGSEDTAGGFVIFMTHNASGNRQVCFGASENFGNVGTAVFRFLCGAFIANLDAVTGNGGARLPFNLGTTTSDVAVGNNELTYAATIGAKLRVYQEADKVGSIVSAAATGTADLQRWSDNANAALLKVTITGVLQSVLTTGTAPFIVASTTAVANLNADLLDGQHGAYYQDASNLNAGTLDNARLDAQLQSLAGLSYGGNALKVVRVNAGETDFELAAPSSGYGRSFMLMGA